MEIFEASRIIYIICMFCNIQLDWRDLQRKFFCKIQSSNIVREFKEEIPVHHCGLDLVDLRALYTEKMMRSNLTTSLTIITKPPGIRIFKLSEDASIQAFPIKWFLRRMLKYRYSKFPFISPWKMAWIFESLSSVDALSKIWFTQHCCMK